MIRPIKFSYFTYACLMSFIILCGCVATRSNLHGEDIHRVDRKSETLRSTFRLAHFTLEDSVYFRLEEQVTSRLRSYRVYRVVDHRVQETYSAGWDLAELVIVPILAGGSIAMWPVYSLIIGFDKVDSSVGIEDRRSVKYSFVDDWLLPLASIAPGYQFFGPRFMKPVPADWMQPTDQEYLEPIPEYARVEESVIDGTGSCRAFADQTEIPVQRQEDGWSSVSTLSGVTRFECATPSGRIIEKDLYRVSSSGGRNDLQ